MDDPELLRQYVERGSHEAFAELVHRHLGIVYASALRQMGDAHAAEDVAQAVFIALAQNARRIDRGRVLSAWLLGVTCKVAALSKRTEARRRRRERQAAELSQARSMGNEHDPWEQVAPYLDEAIGQMRQGNREAVLLRYFQGLSAEQMAARMAISPEAARQRVSRGLEQLRSILSRKAVVVSSATLAGLIPAHAVEAAPAGLAATITTATASASATGILMAKGAAVLMTSGTKAKIVIVAMVLALIGGTAALVAPEIIGGGDAAVLIAPEAAVPVRQGLIGAPAEVAAPGAAPGAGPAGMVGQAALAAPLKLPDGRQLRLSDFRGRHVLLHAWMHPSAQPPGDRKGNLPVIWERFGGEADFAMVGLAPESVPTWAPLGNTLIRLPALPTMAAAPTPWPQGYGSRDNDEMENYLRSQACYVIDPEGKIVQAVFDVRAAYGELDRRLSRGSIATAPIRVLSRHKPLAEASPAYGFDGIPPIAVDDAGQGAALTVLDGGPGIGRDVAVLTDGRGARHQDDLASSFHLFHHWMCGRLRMDLGRTVNIAQINSYSWHNATRAPQVYRLFGSDGKAAGFDPTPRRGVDPGKCGWNLIAFVDTRRSQVVAEMGGQYAASVRSDTGSIGEYRYLLFMMFVTETEDWWGHTFYNEIDVVEKGR